VPVLAFGVIAWILSGLTAGEWKALAVVFGIGLVMYLGSRPSRRAESARAAENPA
jgi:hypothetical protein